MISRRVVSTIGVKFNSRLDGLWTHRRVAEAFSSDRAFPKWPPLRCRWPNRVQHVWDETAHVDGSAYRPIEEEKGQEEGGQGDRLKLQLAKESQRQQISRLAPSKSSPKNVVHISQVYWLQVAS